MSYILEKELLAHEAKGTEKNIRLSNKDKSIEPLQFFFGYMD